MNIVQFARDINKLKRLKRTGWVIQKVKQPESVAEHSFRTAIFAYVLTKPIKHVNTDKLVKMALVHDLGEIFAGDIPTGLKREKKKGYLEAKHVLEEKAFKKLLLNIPLAMRKEIYNLWDEYEDQETAEAKWLKDLDKLEMALQALDYELEGHDPKKLDQFWEDAQHKIKEPKVLEILKRALKLRRKEK